MTFDKEEYWKRRNEGKSGIPKPVTTKAVLNEEGDKNIGFDINGNIIIKNRAWRRKSTKLPTTMQKKKNKRKK